MEETIYELDDAVVHDKGGEWTMPPKLGECANTISSIASSYEIYVGPLPKSVNLKRIIFNPPATIAVFSDGSKSVVKAQSEDKYDPEKGISLAIAKRFLSKKQYNTMLMAANCARVYDLSGIKGEINIDAEKRTLKLTESAK